jgi:hypothetical protein
MHKINFRYLYTLYLKNDYVLILWTTLFIINIFEKNCGYDYNAKKKSVSSL